jgi:sterol desaturase/sphingolipid hydroxylase (fatty acid hydroxylase superfamily)
VLYLIAYKVIKDKIIHKKIQKRFPKSADIWHEVKYSISSITIIAGLTVFAWWTKSKGWTMMYDNFDDYGVLYFIFSIVVYIVFHDTYFYWAHRFMHLPAIYPHVHKVHHHSTKPTPLASFSFHPIEAVLEGIGGLLPIYFLPLHPIAISIFLLFSVLANIFGHLGFEIFPRGKTKSKKWGWTNTVTHHDMHHSTFNYNYSIYFNWWDKWMGTNHEKYHETFEKVARAKPVYKLKENEQEVKLPVEIPETEDESVVIA